MTAKQLQILVTRYAKLSALKNLIDKWLEHHKPDVLSALENESCPDRGPYLLERKEVLLGPNYKVLLVERLRADGMNDEAIGTYISSHTTGTCIRLEKRINPHYRGTFTVKLPA